MQRTVLNRSSLKSQDQHLALDRKRHWMIFFSNGNISKKKKKKRNLEMDRQGYKNYMRRHQSKH